MKQVTLITDGACKKNPGPGGWAAILRIGTVEKIIVGGEPHSTNNRQELLAVINGLEALKEPVEVTVVTDSQYITRAFDERWVNRWQQNGWKTNAGPVKNQDLWERLIPLVGTHKVVWQWVKGHSGHPDNDRADALAQAEALKQA
jgi:ribonuclease HI